MPPVHPQEVLEVVLVACCDLAVLLKAECIADHEVDLAFELFVLEETVHVEASAVPCPLTHTLGQVVLVRQQPVSQLVYITGSNH